MELSYEILVFLLFAAMLAGCIDAIAGGGGLIALPAMLMCGVPPVAAIATNKLGGVGGTLSASLHFIKTGDVQIKNMLGMMLMTFIGALVGGIALTQIDSSFLAVIIPFLLIGFSIYFIFSPNLGELDRRKTHFPSGVYLCHCHGNWFLRWLLWAGNRIVFRHFPGLTARL